MSKSCAPNHCTFNVQVDFPLRFAQIPGGVAQAAPSDKRSNAATLTPLPLERVL